MSKKEIPEVGDICLFHDEPLNMILDCPEDCSYMIDRFYLYDGSEYETRSGYGFRYCTQLVRSLKNEQG